MKSFGENSQESRSIIQSLIDLEDSCLAIIDVQSCFLDKLPGETANELVRRIVWIVNAANALGVPIVMTAEDIAKNGSIIPKLEEAISTNFIVHNKMVFGLDSDPNILKNIMETGRRTVILCGLETDVCVTHSALGLLGKGYQVAVVEDGCCSPGSGHATGIRRMEKAGALITSTKSLYYEWQRDLQHCRDFYRQNRELMDSYESEL